MMKVITSLGEMWIKAFMRAPPGVGSLARARSKSMPTSSPLAKAKPAPSASRRVRPFCHSLTSGSTLYPNPDPHVGAASTDVSGHRRINVGIIRRRIARQKRRGGHDLPWLTVPALHDLQIEPRLLNFGAGVGLTHPLDRCNRPISDRSYRELARSDSDPIQVNGACTALGDAAAEFRAGHPKNIAQHPQQR